MVQRKVTTATLAGELLAHVLATPHLLQLDHDAADGFFADATNSLLEAYSISQKLDDLEAQIQRLA